MSVTALATTGLSPSSTLLLTSPIFSLRLLTLSPFLPQVFPPPRPHIPFPPFILKPTWVCTAQSSRLSAPRYVYRVSVGALTMRTPMRPTNHHPPKKTLFTPAPFP